MAASFLTCMSAACTSELDESISELNGIYLDLNFTTAETRANLNPDGTGSFSEGDKIGLYINNNTSVEYREVTLTNGIWQPRLRRSDFGEGPLTLSAHYPILPDDGSEGTERVIPIAADQTAEGYAASDLLFARKELAAGDNRAAMTFTRMPCTGSGSNSRTAGKSLRCSSAAGWRGV